MKRIMMISVLITVMSTSAFAQRWVNFNAGAYAGLNCAESSPIAGALVSMDVAWFRVELDAGWTYFWINPPSAEEEPNANTPYTKNLVFINPSIGAVIGYDFKVFCLVGITNWFGIDKRLETYRTNILCPKIKLGGEIPVLPFLSINLAWNCVLNPSRDHFEVNDANLIVASVVFKF